MAKSTGGRPDEELKDILPKLRMIADDYRDGRITWVEFVKRHNEVVPGIGDMEHETGFSTKDPGPGRC